MNAFFVPADFTCFSKAAVSFSTSGAGIAAEEGPVTGEKGLDPPKNLNEQSQDVGATS